MQISAKQSELAWLASVLAPFLTAFTAVVAAANGLGGFAILCVLWTIAAAWTALRPPPYHDVFVEPTGIQIVRKDVIKFIPYSQILQIEPYRRRPTRVRITFNSDDGAPESITFLPSPHFGPISRAAKAKDYLSEKMLLAPSESPKK